MRTWPVTLPWKSGWSPQIKCLRCHAAGAARVIGLRSFSALNLVAPLKNLREMAGFSEFREFPMSVGAVSLIPWLLIAVHV